MPAPHTAHVAASSRRMPLAVKLLALGLCLLGAVYALKLLRDQKADAETDRSKARLEHALPPFAVKPAASGATK